MTTLEVKHAAQNRQFLIAIAVGLGLEAIFAFGVFVGASLQR